MINPFLQSIHLLSLSLSFSLRLDPLFVALLETGYPFLKELYLWNLTLRNEDALCIARYVRQRRDFIKVELLGCKFSDDKGLPSLAEGLGFNKHIQKLNFSFVPLGTEGMRVLALGGLLLLLSLLLSTKARRGRREGGGREADTGTQAGTKAVSISHKRRQERHSRTWHFQPHHAP